MNLEIRKLLSDGGNSSQVTKQVQVLIMFCKHTNQDQTFSNSSYISKMLALVV